MVAKLIDLNRDRFDHIDPLTLRMTMITNKEPDGTFKVIKVGNPVAMFCPFRYVVVVHQGDWEQYGEDQKALSLFRVLNSLEPDEDEPKIISPDVKEHSVMLRTFGVDYMQNPEIKNLFTKPVDWIA
jgi:hypothetical protein